jgi:hypothetical protein
VPLLTRRLPVDFQHPLDVLPERSEFQLKH